jgi:exopolysaccharide biosynthesis polyprenyl glycosylphosphotransferase
MVSMLLTSISGRKIVRPRPAVSQELRSVYRARAHLRRFLASVSATSWACLDALIIALATSGAQAVLALAGTGYKWIANPWLASTIFCASFVTGGLVFGLYERKTLLSRSSIACRSALALGLGIVLAYASLSLFFYSGVSRWTGLAIILVYPTVALPLRLFAHEVITTSRARLLCVGAGESMQRLVDIVRRRIHQNYEVVGHVRLGDTAESAGSTPGAPARFRTDADRQFAEACPCLGELRELEHVLAAHEIDEVVVGPDLTGNATVGRAVAVCLEGHCRVTDQATFVEKLLGEVPADSITAEWFLRADVQNHGSYEAVKRFMDIAAALFGLLLTLPLWPLIAIAIRLDSRGPALYRQMRVGQHGRPFQIYKFRTMRLDAEANGAQWAGVNDVRVTRLGRFLRKSRLDELPQLWNIFRGDMSLVGPRPERPEFVHNLEQLLPHYRLRHLIKPGLTGWAQIHYGYGASVADTHRKLCYDLYYLKHRSLDLDAGVLIRTFGTFVLGAR